MMNSFTLLVALATVIAVCEGTFGISGIVVRQANTSTAGGFATRATTCSTTQVDCGGGITQEICCPLGTFCFHSDDTVCCPTDDDCNPQFFAAPQCADPSMFLCTDYQPNIPSYVPNDPGYWCCPTGTQCLVSPEAGFVCSAVNDGDIPGSTVLSGQAPTQASTATTLPTLSGSATTTASGANKSSPITLSSSGPVTLSSPGTSSSPAASSSPTSYATKTSSFPIGILVGQALFALTVTALI